MPSYNRVIFVGHLTRDPEVKFLPSQTAVCEFGMAANRTYKVGEEKREEVCFIDCACFGKGGETIAQYVKKGAPLLIDGRLKFDSWEDKAGGKRSKLSVIVENFQFLGGRDEGDDSDQREQYPRNRQSVTSKPARVADPFGDEQQFKESDIPFAWTGRDQQPL